MAAAPFLTGTASGGGRSPQQRRHRLLRRHRHRESPAEIIDLTCEDTSTEATPWSSVTVIDLTNEDTCSPPPPTDCADGEPAGPAGHASHPRLCFTTKQETEGAEGLSPTAPQHDAPAYPCAAADTAGTVENKGCCSPASSHHSSFCSPEQNCSTTTFNSDLGSLASMLLDPDLFSLSPSSLHSSSSSCGNCGTEEETPHTSQLKELPTSPSPVPGNIATSPGKAKGPLLEEGDSALKTATQQATSTPGRTTADSRVWLNKLRYFRRSGVHHLSFHGLTRNRETLQKAELIPSRRLSMVQTTIEENFLEGTLHLLNDFVSGQHYPPKETISHLVRHILLNPHQGEVLKDTYMLLMKIQMLHPATTSTMGWNWALLKYIMEDQEKPPGRLLFLQYVVQTLEDDFQHNLRLRLLQKSIAKKVLSCNGCFSNVKEVVEWLVAAVTGIGFSQPQEAEGTHSAAARAECSSPAARPCSAGGAEALPSTVFAQKAMFLLQRMLSMAVEVDRSPNCNSYKIADLIFPFILNIPVRSQREALLNSMDSHLLRCKLLEMMFHHSCDVPTTLPLSLSKILYFLGHSSVLLQYQDDVATWQRWDEMLEYLSLLLISYQNVILAFPLADHLRSSLYERMDLIIQKAKPRLQDDDEISHLDIYLKTEDFLSRMQQLLGQPFPLQINEKVCMIQQLFLIFTAT
ncbi:SUMO-interacting motif-containing protein 1 isoform X2 [Anas platyrhynchos]|uniref:SUMO-interacting motif-containing protein 1 isoform X2 n=1 Tax=Anas platyrhynchos TaxID=8839 RepID=UPI003AF281C2